jgi:hypothetical protein
VLYAEVDALLNVAIADDLVNDNTNGMRSDIIHNSGPPMEHIIGLRSIKVTRTDPW